MKKSIFLLTILLNSMMMIAQNPDSNKIIITGYDDHTEIKIGDSVFKISYDYMAREKLKEGIRKGAEGDYAGAVNEFNSAILFDPGNAEIFYNRGLAWYYLDDYQKALKDYSSAIYLDSNYYRAYNERGIIKCKQGNYEDGSADFKQAIRIDSSYSTSYFNLGISYLQMNNFAEGCKYLKTAKEMGYTRSEEVYNEYCE